MHEFLMFGLQGVIVSTIAGWAYDTFSAPWFAVVLALNVYVTFVRRGPL